MSAYTGSGPNSLKASIGAIDSFSICIRTPSDVDRLYILLTTYAQDPARAALVTEVTIDTAYFHRGHYTDSAYATAENIVSNESISFEAHIGLKNYVQGLDLDDEMTARWIQSVDWKRSHLDGTWQDSTVEHYEENGKNFAEAATAVLLSLCENILTLYLADGLHSEHLDDFMLWNNYG